MVSLTEVTGALISQINKGRVQADMAVLDVAGIYKEHPFLSSFSIPRMTLDEVNVELKVAFAAGPSTRVSLTPESRSRVISRARKLVQEDLPAKYRYIQSLAQNREIWEPLNVTVEKELSELVVAEVEVKPESAAIGVAALIQQRLMKAVLHPKFTITKAGASKFVEEDVPHIEEYVKDEMKKVIAEVIASQPPPKDRLDVLITAADLKEIPSERITVVKLTLRDSDLAWTQIETKDGKVEKRLVPY